MKVSVVRARIDVCLPVDLSDMDDVMRAMRSFESLKTAAKALGPVEAACKVGNEDETRIKVWLEEVKGADHLSGNKTEYSGVSDFAKDTEEQADRDTVQ